MNNVLIKTSLSWVIIVLTFCISFGQLYGPEISNISINDGLSQNTVTAMLQDEKGFLWIGTQDGLNKYDGHSFRLFTSSGQDTSSLSNNYIKAIVQDGNGNLWLATQIGLTRYDSKKGIFKRFLFDLSKNDTIPNNVINDLIIDGNSLWIATDKGLIYMKNINKPSFEHLRNVTDDEGDFFRINDMVLDKRSDLWIATDDNGIYKVDRLTHENFQLNIKGFDLNDGIGTINVFNDIIWVGLSSGLLSIDPDLVVRDNKHHQVIAKNVKLYPKPTQNSFVTNILKDDDDVVWVGTQSEGVFTLDTIANTLNSFVVSHNESPDVFGALTVTEIFEDYSHKIWIGTLESGLFKVRKSVKKFGLLKSMAGKKNGLSSNRVRGLLEIGDHLWIATAKGLNRFSRSTLNCEVLEHDPETSYTISSNDVKTLDIDNQGNLWIATNNGLNQLDTSTLRFKRFYAGSVGDGSLIINNKVRTVKVLSDNNVWVGTLGGGITVIDPVSFKVLNNYIHDPTDSTSLSDNSVMDIFEASDHTIWVATYGGGLNLLRDDATGFKRVPNGEGIGLSKLLTSIHEDPDGILWVGSYGDGLFRINPDDFSYKVYTKETGLSNNVVYAAIPEGNSIWISTNHGLNKYNRLTRNFSKYNVFDGLQSNEFNSGSYLKSETTGELFFGGVNGLTFFNPDSIRSNRLPPQLAFTDFRIFNKSVKPEEIVIKGDPPLNEMISDSATISLSHYHNVFTIEFAALDYTNPEDNRYAYQLEGFDPDWIYSNSNQRAITYTNLKPGSYIFKMNAANNDGVWNEQPSRLFINISPVIWQRWWFKALIVLSIASLIIAYVYKRITKTERKRKHLEYEIKKHTREISQQNEVLLKSEDHLRNINKKKDQMFYALAHHVRGPLTSLFSLMQYSDLGSKEIKKDDRKIYLKQLNEKVGHSLLLLDNTYYWSLLQFDQINLKSDRVDICELVQQSIEKHKIAANSKNISIRLENIGDYIIRCDKKMTAIIVENLITNAIKYSHKNGAITIRFILNESKIKLIVEDGGVGLSDEELKNLFDEQNYMSTIGTQKENGSGLGLQLSNKLAEKMNFNLFANCENSCTKFCLVMPYHEKNGIHRNSNKLNLVN